MEISYPWVKANRPSWEMWYRKDYNSTAIIGWAEKIKISGLWRWAVDGFEGVGEIENTGISESIEEAKDKVDEI